MKFKKNLIPNLWNVPITHPINEAHKDKMFLERQKTIESIADDARDNVGHNFNVWGDLKDNDSRLVLPNTLGISRWLPRFSRDGSKSYPKNLSSNKYLTKQFKRIYAHITAGRVEQAIRIWMVLFQRSDSYLVYHLNRTLRGWYWKYSYGTVKSILRKVRTANRKLDSFALFERVYIPKPNGKIRPLGVPLREWRISISMITQIVTMIIEPKLPDHQHGFRNGKSCITAWQNVISKFEDGYTHLYEFDLKACFNKISIRSTLHLLETQHSFPRVMLNYLDHLLSSTPHIRSLDPSDKEVIKKSNGTYQKKGLPQGWSLSPILAISTIHEALKDWNVVMYADDGIIFSKSPHNPTASELDRIRLFGVEFADELDKNGKSKCGPIEHTFTFLGVTGNLLSQTCLLGGEEVGWFDRDFETKLKKHYLGYFNSYDRDEKPSQTDWEWDVNDWSWLALEIPYTSPEHKELFREFFTGRNGDVKRVWYCRYVKYSEISSRACESLLTELAGQSQKGRCTLISWERKYDYIRKESYASELLLSRYWDQTHESSLHPFNYLILDDIRRKQERDRNSLGEYISSYEDNYSTMNTDGEWYVFPKGCNEFILRSLKPLRKHSSITNKVGDHARLRSVWF